VRGKLVLSSLVLLLVVSFAFTAAFLRLSQIWVADELRGRAIAFARSVAATIGDRREFENPQMLRAEIRRIMEARRDVKNIDFLAFGEPWPRVLVTTDPTWRPPLSTEQRTVLLRGRDVARLVDDRHDRYWEVVAPIVLEGGVAGAVALEFSLAQADEQAARVRATALVITGGSVLVAVLLMSLVVGRVVGRPVREMLGVINRVEAGDRGAALSTGRREDEFGLLAFHFNQMLERLNRASQVQEERVQEATAELGRRYEELRRLNELLFQIQRRLRHSERLAVMGRTLSIVAHEVGTPLHSVAGHLELLRQELPPELVAGSPGRRVSTVQAQLVRVTETIEQLLSASRPPTGSRAPVDLNAVVRDVLDLVGAGMAAGVKMETALAADAPPVPGDASQLQQAFLNIVANALDAMPGGGVLTVRSSVERRGTGPWVLVRIGDSGPGIPAGHLKQIFEPFFTTKELGKGTGLGLFITRQIVLEHGGSLEVESEPGQGAVFCLAFPVQPPKA
jgi:signal transduction histidine kinase